MFTLVLIILTMVLVLYAIVVSGKRPLLTFIIIPVFLYTAFHTYQIINYYKGTPIFPPPAEEVTLVGMAVSKPWILLLIKEDTHETPRYYIMPYESDDREQYEGMQGRLEKGQVLRGTFEPKNLGENEKYNFVPFNRDYNPKQTEQKPEPTTIAVPG